MKTLNDLQRQIINALTFTEPFDTLVEEVSAPEAVIADELKTLIDQRMVQVMVEEGGHFQKTFYYDTDNMRAFRYEATSRGLDLLSV